MPSTQPQLRRLLTVPTAKINLRPSKMWAFYRSLRSGEFDGIDVTCHGQSIARLSLPYPREHYAIKLRYSDCQLRISRAARQITQSGERSGLIEGSQWALDLRPILATDRVLRVIE